jgi:NTF2-like protein (DUF6841)
VWPRRFRRPRRADRLLRRPASPHNWRRRGDAHDEADVLDAIGGQIAGLRAAGYHRTETLDSETTVISATTALHAAEFSRQRADGSEIGRLRARYLITLGAHGRRISALAVHSA